MKRSLVLKLRNCQVVRYGNWLHYRYADGKSVWRFLKEPASKL